MKPIEDLTDAELCDLDESALNRYTDLQCAEEGIPLLPTTVPTPPSARAIEPDQKAYLVQLYFTARADAERIANDATKFPTVTKEYRNLPGKGYRHAYVFEPVLPGISAGITEDSAYSAMVAATMGANIAEHEAAKEQYTKEKADFDAIAEKRGRIAASFRGLQMEATARKRRRDRYQGIFDRYVELAEGSRRTACRFMAAAHPDADEVIPEAFSPDADGPMPTGQRRYEVDAQEQEIL